MNTFVNTLSINFTNYQLSALKKVLSAAPYADAAPLLEHIELELRRRFNEDLLLDKCTDGLM
jgi:hypothetical protein